VVHRLSMLRADQYSLQLVAIIRTSTLPWFWPVTCRSSAHKHARVANMSNE